MLINVINCSGIQKVVFLLIGYPFKTLQKFSALLKNDMLIICIINFVAADDKWSDLTGFCLETGVHRGPPDRGVHVRRHDEDQVVALRSQKSSRTHSKISAGNAGAGNGGIALKKYHQTRTHQHDSQLPQGNYHFDFFHFWGEFGPGQPFWNSTLPIVGLST